MPYRYAMVFLALAACTNGPNGRAGSSAMNQEPTASPATTEPIASSVPEDGGVRIFTFVQAKPVPGQPAPTFHQVAVTGKLTVKNGCLVLESGSRQLALVFREGTASFDQARNALTVDGQTFNVGSTVSMGGSGGSAVESMPQGNPKQHCGADESWMVVPGSFKPAE